MDNNSALEVLKDHLFHNKMIIAGPCALENRQSLKTIVHLLHSEGIRIVRASLWKPRTSPGWDGIGLWGLYTLLEETLPLGIIPATEIVSSTHVHALVEVMKNFGEHGRIIVWLGARNQNHFEIRTIAKILADAGPQFILIYKNQMWEDEKHWQGIGDHILKSGFPRERLIACHRGFAPGRAPNQEGYRNLPNFEMAMQIKQKMQIPMLLDPSHIGGSQEKCLEILRQSQNYEFDGILVEVHENPLKALTDSQQQLDHGKLKEALEIIRNLDLERKAA